MDREILNCAGTTVVRVFILNVLIFDCVFLDNTQVLFMFRVFT